LSGWILVIISIDRYLSIVFPNRFACRKKTFFQIFVCLIVFLFNLVFYSPTNFYYLKFHNSTNGTINSVKCDNSGYPMEWLDFLNIAILPFTFMIIFTLLTLKSLFESRRNSTLSNDNIKRKDIKFAITSIALNCFFLMINIPFNIYTVIKFKIESADSSIINFLAYASSYLNSSNLFYVNIVVNSMFRNEFMKMFSCKKIISNLSGSFLESPLRFCFYVILSDKIIEFILLLYILHCHFI
jgi:hypothetical protein